MLSQFCMPGNCGASTPGVVQAHTPPRCLSQHLSNFAMHFQECYCSPTSTCPFRHDIWCLDWKHSV